MDADRCLKAEVLQEFDALSLDHEIEESFLLHQKRTLSNRRAQEKWASNPVNRAKKNAWMRAYLSRPDVKEKNRPYYTSLLKSLREKTAAKKAANPGPRKTTKAQAEAWARKRKLTMKQAKELRVLRSDGLTHTELARRFGISRSGVQHILNGSTYRTPEVNYG